MSWREITDWVKRREPLLRLADWMGRGRGRTRWLDHLNAPPASPLKPDLGAWARTPLAAIWLGHATVLLRIGGKTILTDPVLCNRVGIGLGLVTGGPRRHVAPALTIRELPPIDLMRRHHVPMAVATDYNPGTSPLTSILMAMNMASTLFRLTIDEVMAGVPRNAARSLGRLDEIGTLEVGKRCDLAIWNAERPAELVYRLGFNSLHQRVFAGRPANRLQAN